MSCLIGLAVIGAGAWVLLYRRAPLIAWTGSGAVLLAIWMAASASLNALHYLVLLLFIAIAAILHVTALRRTVVSAPILRLFSAVMPAMSVTEREALEAGSVWWDAELFSGNPDWNKLFAYQQPKLSEAEQAFLDGPAETLCAMLNDWQITEREHDLPADVWAFIKANGFFGMIIPKRYGGLEFSAYAHSAVVMKVASRSVTAAVTIMVPNSLGPAELLLEYGTREQQDHYLPRLAKGEEVPCFALTGPDAGSDAGAMPDSGVICRGTFEGEEIIGIRLNWNKRYITLGPVATILGLAFKLYDPDHLLGDKEEIGITCALIPTKTEGVTIGRRHAPLNIPFQNGPNQGSDVFIPLDWIIGGADRAGQGWRMLMESLAVGRSISLPALSTGAGKLMSRATGAYARIRRQFKTPIGHFEGVEEALTRIAGYTYSMDATRTMTLGALDSGEKPSVISAIAKYNLTERMRHVVSDAMDVQGGSGICMGPRNFLGRVYQSIPIGITVEGANILTRSMIIFGQGAIRCHPYVFSEMQAVAKMKTEPEKALHEFDAAFFNHTAFTLTNAARALFLGLTDGRFCQVPGNEQSQRYIQQLTRLSAAFALCTDVGMLTLGGSLKRKEKLSGRFADILSHLYIASATLKRFADQGAQEEDLPLFQWVCEDALYQSQRQLDGLIRNLPNRPAAWVMRLLVFPLGRHYRAPSDQLGHKVARLLLADSASRDRLTKGIYLPQQDDEALARLERALNHTMKSAAIEKKVRAALQAGRINGGDETSLLEQALTAEAIDAQEAEQLRLAIAARNDAIQVDDFPADYWK
ncbi:MAG: acyl-CoA dehydrogenase [Gammaproteobacteria bacterium]|nr:acyl-CoA dehydrogenase [Gammaproteobacteria bacterium]